MATAGYTPSRVAVLEEEEYEAQENATTYIRSPLVQVNSSLICNKVFAENV